MGQRKSFQELSSQHDTFSIGQFQVPSSYRFRSSTQVFWRLISKRTISPWYIFLSIDQTLQDVAAETKDATLSEMTKQIKVIFVDQSRRSGHDPSLSRTNPALNL